MLLFDAGLSIVRNQFRVHIRYTEISCSTSVVILVSTQALMDWWGRLPAIHSHITWLKSIYIDTLIFILLQRWEGLYWYERWTVDLDLLLRRSILHAGHRLQSGVTPIQHGKKLTESWLQKADDKNFLSQKNETKMNIFAYLTYTHVTCILKWIQHILWWSYVNWHPRTLLHQFSLERIYSNFYWTSVHQKFVCWNNIDQAKPKLEWCNLFGVMLIVISKV